MATMMMMMMMESMWVRRWTGDEQRETENDRSLLGSDFDKSDLTENEQRQYRKIEELRSKRAKLRSSRRSAGSDAAAKLDDQIESMEQSLYDR